MEANLRWQRNNDSQLSTRMIDRKSKVIQVVRKKKKKSFSFFLSPFLLSYFTLHYYFHTKFLGLSLLINDLFS